MLVGDSVAPLSSSVEAGLVQAKRSCPARHRPGELVRGVDAASVSPRQSSFVNRRLDLELFVKADGDFSALTACKEFVSLVCAMKGEAMGDGTMRVHAPAARAFDTVFHVGDRLRAKRRGSGGRFIRLVGQGAG